MNTGETRAALITGATKGIGRAAALALLEQGYTVIAVGRDESALNGLAQGSQGRVGAGRVIAIGADLAEPAGQATLAARLREENVTLDALLLCAGIVKVGNFFEVPFSTWERVVSVNLLATMAVLHGARPLLRRGARVVVVGSIAEVGFPTWSAYSASKGGLKAFSSAIREELRGDGISLTHVTLGATATTLWDDVAGDFDRAKMLAASDVGSQLAELVGPRWEVVEEIALKPKAGKL